VAKGFTQIEDVDYFGTFSPVVKLPIICLIIALTNANNWIGHQLDVDNAFFHRDLREEIYMKPL